MKVALIGRSNVGKSSVFNRIVGGRIAIVDDSLGVTRDRREARGKGEFSSVSVIDTPGVVEKTSDDLAKKMNEQSFLAVQEADLVCFVIDALDGITSEDKFIAEWLRKSYKKLGLNKPTAVIVNKSENLSEGISVRSLGFGEAIYVSAEHNVNMQDLYEVFLAHIDDDTSSEEDEINDCIRIAIAGRPNVGKSTLINAAIGENRLITGDMAGITRDSISVPFEFNGKKIQITDTAGQRRSSKIDDNLENVSVLDAWRYIKQAHVVIVVIDVNIPFEKQDLNIARKVIDEGKIVIFALNKVDVIENTKGLLENMTMRLEKEFAQVPKVPCIPISAINKKNIGTLFVHAINLFEKWNTRIPTSKLNMFLERAIENYHPPLVKGMPIRLKFMTQTNTRPPSFAIMANRGEELPDSYKRYLLNRMREAFDLYSIPLRLFIRTRNNPYQKKKKR